MSPIISGCVSEKRSPLLSRSFFASAKRSPRMSRLVHPVGADGRAHRAVDDGDAASGGAFRGLDGRTGGSDGRARFNLPSCSSWGRCVGLSAMARTTWKCGFLASRQATSQATTASPARVSSAAERARREAGVALAVRRGDLLLLVLVEREERRGARPGGGRARTPRARAPGARRTSACGRRGPRRTTRRENGRSWTSATSARTWSCPPSRSSRGVDHAGAHVDAGERCGSGARASPPRRRRRSRRRARRPAGAARRGPSASDCHVRPGE